MTEGVKVSANPFDEIALEEALRLRDAGIASEVVIATLAPNDVTAHLRNGLAMGPTVLSTSSPTPQYNHSLRHALYSNWLRKNTQHW